MTSSGSGIGTAVVAPSSAITNANLRTLLKANLHNDSGFADPTDLDLFLTMGQQRIVRDSPQTLGTHQGTLSLTAALGRTYALASDFYQMQGVFDPDNSRYLDPIDRQQWISEVESQSTIPSGPPQQYCIWGFGTGTTATYQQIRFDYEPAEDTTIYYWYFWMPEAISGSTVCAISALGFSNLLVQAATMLALQRNDPEGHTVAAANYQAELRSYQAYAPDQPDYVPVLGGARRGFSRLGPHFPADTF